jgi:hypothetical protein
MDARLKIAMDKHHEACMALIEHLDCRDDEKGLSLFRELGEYEFMLLELMNDGLKDLDRAAAEIQRRLTPSEGRK